MNNRKKPILQVKNLSVDFPIHKQTIKAVQDVSFDLYAGETLCVVGESGSGKSVTARAILQLIVNPGKIMQGELLFESLEGAVDIAQLDKKGKQIRKIRGNEIAMIFQEPMTSLSPVHTIGHQLVEAILLHNDISKAEAKSQAAELLRRVKIPNPEQALNSYSFEFSGGMRQRAMIAMALSCKPKVLIADEPTTALDVTTQAEILDLIAELQKDEEMAVLFITHDMGVVAQIADRVMVMYRGQKIEDGLVQQVLEQPKEAYTKALLNSVLKLETPPMHAKPDAKPKTIIDVKDLKLQFSSGGGLFKKPTLVVKAIDGVNLTINEGERLGIVGESGSGKTTLGRSLLGIYPPNEGVINYTRKTGEIIQIEKANKATLKSIYGEMRMIFQDPHSSLNPRMTIFETIAEPLRANTDMSMAQMRDRVQFLLEKVGMPSEVANRYPHAFSGGQRQRICIARAIALNPRVIIADEPTSALDVSLRHQVLDLMLNLQKEFGIAYIFISHDISVVRYFCDRVAVMEKGKIVEIGDVAQICDAPQHPYTQKLISSVPRPDLKYRKKPLLQTTMAYGDV
ncbi:MAG: ABC transporter ATP-binding protein [OCS116 cluster bacterium]|nr:ABC transporter ATP-binding protein [OCS116 cluster bacterium]